MAFNGVFTEKLSSLARSPLFEDSVCKQAASVVKIGMSLSCSHAGGFGPQSFSEWISCVKGRMAVGGNVFWMTAFTKAVESLGLHKKVCVYWGRLVGCILEIISKGKYFVALLK